jgi:hypothetical protein
MSFQATHLQFAYQVKDILKINDLDSYYSGVLYPDSRYITKIKRDLTHGKARIKLREIKNPTDDFNKGWQVHCWYDKLGLPKLFNIATGLEYHQGEMEKINYWVPVTGAKLVEDLYWWHNNDWSNILKYLKVQKQPNNENLAVLNQWYHHFNNFFQNNPDLQNYKIQADFMGIDSDKSHQIIEFAYKLYNNKTKRKQLEKIMEKVKSAFLNSIK